MILLRKMLLNRTVLRCAPSFFLLDDEHLIYHNPKPCSDRCLDKRFSYSPRDLVHPPTENRPGARAATVGGGNGFGEGGQRFSMGFGGSARTGV